MRTTTKMTLAMSAIMIGLGGGLLYAHQQQKKKNEQGKKSKSVKMVRFASPTTTTAVAWKDFDAATYLHKATVFRRSAGESKEDSATLVRFLRIAMWKSALRQAIAHKCHEGLFRPIFAASGCDSFIQQLVSDEFPTAILVITQHTTLNPLPPRWISVKVGGGLESLLKHAYDVVEYRQG